MAAADRRRWNERFAAEGERAAGPPLPRLVAQEALLRRALALAPAPAPGDPQRGPPLALDLACGPGRNSLYLAGLGYTVDAWDISDVALARLTAAAAAAGLGERIRTRRVDLDDVEAPAGAGAGAAVRLPPGAYRLVVDSYFLDRRLLPALAAAVAPGGLLYLETLLSTPQRPGRPDYYLQPGELGAAFPSLRTRYLEESAGGEGGWAALLAGGGD